MKYVYVFGSKGMMGSNFIKYIKKYHKYNNITFIPLDRTNFDVLKDSLDNCIPYNTDTLILNFIGCIPQKKYLDEEYIKINEEFPKKLIHLSTNCVFNGKSGKYLENTEILYFNDIYSYSKYSGEPQYGLTIRASIIGIEENSSYGLCSWFLNSKNSEVNGYINVYWNGITTLELSKIIYEKIIFDEDFKEKKLIHIYSKDIVSKFQLLTLIKKVFNKNIIINPLSIPEDKFYTLSSLTEEPRKNIEEQLQDLYLF